MFRNRGQNSKLMPFEGPGSHRSTRWQIVLKNHWISCMNHTVWYAVYDTWYVALWYVCHETDISYPTAIKRQFPCLACHSKNIKKSMIHQFFNNRKIRFDSIILYQTWIFEYSANIHFQYIIFVWKLHAVTHNIF